VRVGIPKLIVNGNLGVYGTVERSVRPKSLLLGHAVGEVLGPIDDGPLEL
jgi:hypothetical protein